MLKKVFKSTEAILFLIIVCISIIFGMINPTFLTLGNWFSIARASIIMSIFAVGVLFVIVSGGIDISFMAIASFSMYVPLKVLVSNNITLPVPVIFMISSFIGLCLGLVNSFFVAKIKLPSFIVTLGTQNMFKGFLLAFIGTSFIVNIPKELVKFSQTYLAVMTKPDGSTSGLHSSVILVAALYIIATLVLKYTMLGRKIYAMGGDPVAAERVGISGTWIRCVCYGISGALAGIGGMMQTSLSRIAMPSELVGNELLVIAAVVLGGGNNAEGKGTALGALLGVLLITILINSLTLLKISSYWQQVVTGVIIIVGTIIQYYKQKTKAIALG